MKLTAVLLMTTLLSLPALATEKVVPEKNQKSLNVTIYNQNRALIKDERTVALDAGANELAFAGVSAQIIPESALLQGINISTREQNFNYDLISQDSLLQKSVGQTVSTEYINPATGEKTVGTAELIAYNNGQPTLKIGNKIETNFPGRIIFDKIPENLRSEPTLIVDINAQDAGTQTLGLSYLTGGLSWNADYVAELNSDETTLGLNGLVTLSNYSGTDYQNAQLQLVAGDVNTVVRPTARAKGLYMENMALTMAADSAMAEEKLVDFHLYTLPRKTDILNNQTKQVALLSGQNIKAVKTYEFRDSFSPYASELKQVKPEIYLTFDNKKDNGLGIALPKGTVRLYKADKSGKMLFVGEDKINHTANTEVVRLKMGKAFDLSADMKKVNRKKLADKTYETEYQITIKNGGETKANVDIYQSFGGQQVRITAENVPSTKENANTFKWVLAIPATGQATLTYKVYTKE